VPNFQTLSICCVLHSQCSVVSTSGSKQSVEPSDSKFSVSSLCTPSRSKPLSQLRPKLLSPSDGKRTTAAVKSELTLMSYCTPSRAKHSLNRRHGDMPHPLSTSLSLPHSYYVLGELFQSTDTIVSWLTNRAEICTFQKLKSAVQDMTKRYEDCWLLHVACLFWLSY